MELDEIIQRLQQAFQLEKAKQLLEPNFRELNIRTGSHSTGFCYYASEAIYILTGGKVGG